MTTFEGIIGHRRVLELLFREASAPASAYLFVGATGVGKATAARRFAAILLCPTSGRHETPCRSCRLAAAGTHPDLVLVEPEGRQRLGVEQARSTIQQSVMTPVESSRKLFLLEEAGSMTEQAANALLKTLEEPSPTSVFVLVAESEDDLPTTVASRCRTIHFGRVDEQELAEGLVARGVDPDRAAGLAGVSGGRPGLALTLLSIPAISEFRQAWLGVPGRVTDRPGESFALAAEMLETVDPLLEAVDVAEGETKAQRERADRERRRARQALLVTGLEILASWYADAAAVQFGGPVRNRDVPVAELTRVAPSVAVRTSEMVLDAAADLRANLRPQLLLADLFASMGAAGAV
jgi:DNA polymerase-3 subunit delta'